jgi:hypothetical protein
MGAIEKSNNRQRSKADRFRLKLISALVCFIFAIMLLTDCKSNRNLSGSSAGKAVSVEDLQAECKKSCRSQFDSQIGACNMQGWDEFSKEYKACIKAADDNYRTCLKECKAIGK